MKYNKHYFLSRGYDFKRDCIRFLPLALTIMRLGAKRVLDLGCAYGALIYVLRKLGIEAWGVDISEYARKVSPVKEFIILRDLNKDAIPFDNEYFDCIIAINFFEHIKPYHCMREAHRVLKRYGILYVSIPSYSERTLRDPYHVSVFPFKVWLRLFESQSFKLNIRLIVKFWLHFATSWLRIRLSKIKAPTYIKLKLSRRCREDKFPYKFLLWLGQSYRLVLIKQ